MHIVHGELRKAPFVKQLTDSTMFAVELSEVIKDYKTGEKVYTNYKAILFAKSEAHVNHYNTTLIEGNFIVLTSEKLKVEISECGKYTKLYMDNARLEGSGYIQSSQQAPQAPPQQGYQAHNQRAAQLNQQQQSSNQAGIQQQGGYQQAPQQQAPAVVDDFSDLPF